MRFLIISHALHKIENKEVYSYAPYVREMNLWLKYVDEVSVIAPIVKDDVNAIDMPYKHDNLVLKKIPSIQFTSLIASIYSFIKLPYILIVIFFGCLKADHIHLRCPGNIGLLGCFIQIFFPKKIKTAKYAGNWDPEAKQPLSYRLQKWILRHAFLTKNINVLIYGEWENQSKNIKPFFTATFKDLEIELPSSRSYSDELKFVFVGSLVKGKRPLLAIKIIETLHREGKDISLNIFGDGVLKESLEEYIQDNKLETMITLHGNKSKEVIKETFKTAHFSILPSKSEGWPKAIAEAMFFGVIPIATKVSCVPFILDYGKRGILVEPSLEEALNEINIHLKDENQLRLMSKRALNWSQNYTLDVFETEISKLLN